MVNNKSSKSQASKISSKSALAASATTKTPQKSSIFHSLFAPSQYQLALFVSVIQGLEGQHLRFHDTNTGRLRCEHAITSKATINCLDWGHYGENNPDRHHQEANRKRKRNSQNNGSAPDPKNIVLAFGTSDSEIAMFSPMESKIVGTLKGEHTQGVKDFKFVDAGIHGQGWSIGGDGKLVQWNLQKGKSIRSFNAPAPSIATLCPLERSLLCASHTTYLVDPESSEKAVSFTTSSHPIHTIKASTAQSTATCSFLTASQAERGINVFSIASRKLVGTLLPGTETTSLSLSTLSKITRGRHGSKDTADRLLFPEQTLAAITKDGILELFPSPFDFAQASSKDLDSVKARVKQMTRRPAAIVKITRPDSSSPHIPLLDCSFDGENLVMAWTEGGVNVVFNRVRWRDEDTGKLLLQGNNELVKAKSDTGVSAVVMNGVKDMGRSHVDESHTVVASGQGAGDLLVGADPSSAIAISSGEEESEYSEDEEIEAMENEPHRVLQDPAPMNQGEDEGMDKEQQPVLQVFAPTDEDVMMKDAEAENDAVAGASDNPDIQEEAGEPSFGELIRAKAPEAIDVQAEFTSQHPNTLATIGDRSLQLPTSMSLGTVLTQSLRTNDVNLLETCFQVKDLAVIRATIERIDSSLATILLERLAERLHSRPGRAGSLMVWVQWTLVAHGGYLASQGELMKKLSSLYRVVDERAKSLHSLLALKGKLDMLEAQMNLRKAMNARSRANMLNDDDDEGIIYVEGQQDSESEDEMLDASAPDEAVSRDMAKASLRDAGSDFKEAKDEAEEEEDDMSVKMNGVIPDSEDDDSESDGGLIDDEAESTDQDSGEEGSEEEIDYDDVDSLSESSDDAPPAKRVSKPKLPNGTGKGSH